MLATATINASTMDMVPEALSSFREMVKQSLERSSAAQDAKVRLRAVMASEAQVRAADRQNNILMKSQQITANQTDEMQRLRTSMLDFSKSLRSRNPALATGSGAAAGSSGGLFGDIAAALAGGVGAGAAGAGTAAGAAKGGGWLSRIGSGLMSGAGALAKRAGPIAMIGAAGYDAYQGFQGETTADKVTGSIGGAINGILLGLPNMIMGDKGLEKSLGAVKDRFVSMDTKFANNERIYDAAAMDMMNGVSMSIVETSNVAQETIKAQTKRTVEDLVDLDEVAQKKTGGLLGGLKAILGFGSPSGTGTGTGATGGNTPGSTTPSGTRTVTDHDAMGNVIGTRSVPSSSGSTGGGGKTGSGSGSSSSSTSNPAGVPYAGGFQDPKTNSNVNPEVLAKYDGKQLPVVIRNNNPAALSLMKPGSGEFAEKQEGYVGATARPANEGGYYAKYATPEHGIAANAKLLERYGEKGVNTTDQIVRKWSTDTNAHAGYSKKLQAALGVDGSTPIDLSNKETQAKILMAKSAHESGAGKAIYTPETFTRGVNRQFPNVGDGGATATPGGKSGAGTANATVDTKSLIGKIDSAGKEATPEEYAAIRGQANKNVKSGERGDWQDPNFVKDNIVKVPVGDGKTVNVHKDAALQFQGFVKDMQEQGYPISSLGGYNKRGNTSDPSKPSEHALGTAIDINPAKNPFTRGGLITDMPANTSKLAAKWGLSWGGDWNSVKDAMHFEKSSVTPKWLQAEIAKQKDPAKFAVATQKDIADNNALVDKAKWSGGDNPFTRGKAANNANMSDVMAQDMGTSQSLPAPSEPPKAEAPTPMAATPGTSPSPAAPNGYSELGTPIPDKPDDIGLNLMNNTDH